ncbi:U4/U6 small nuclear ribonucleoprotein PRP4-like protein [Tanacetum coccineum]|uniref:U4/U6 small nuclear ribonucleoprotein PRP4-like protein n=1 Tax=Tanacetum coccineum TaxID=301880 RepID=A0ABQ4Z373_9ASTR
MHIQNDPSFFLTNKTGDPQGEEQGLIKPLSDSSFSCSNNSFISEGANRQGARATGATSVGVISIWELNAVDTKLVSAPISNKIEAYCCFRRQISRAKRKRLEAKRSGKTLCFKESKHSVRPSFSSNMDLDEELNPNPNSTLSPPNTINGETTIKDESDDDSGLEGEVSKESKLFREKQEKATQDSLIKQSAVVADLAVLKNDKVVRSGLRRLDEPVTLFGEMEMHRGRRLSLIMARLDSKGKLETFMRFLEEEEEGADGGEDEGEAIQYPFYTDGSTAC